MVAIVVMRMISVVYAANVALEKAIELRFLWTRNLFHKASVDAKKRALMPIATCFVAVNRAKESATANNSYCTIRFIHLTHSILPLSLLQLLISKILN